MPRRLAEGALLLGLLGLAALPDGAVLRPKLLWGQSLVLAALGLTAVALAAAGRAPRPWPRVLGLALLPAGLALLHLLHSAPASQALARDEIQRLLLVPLLAAAVGAMLCRDPAARARLLTALALGTLLAAGYAVLQRTGGVLGLGVTPRARAEGGFSNPVFLGGWLVLTTPLLLLEAAYGRGVLRWLCALAGGLALPALLGSKSVGAWGGFGVACVVAALLAIPGQRARRRVLAAACVAALILAVAGRDALFRSRAHGLIWRDSLHMALEHPAGVGPGQFPLAFPQAASPELLAVYPRNQVIVNDAHSEALQLAVELGWTGLAAALLAAFAAALAVRRTRAALAAEPVADGYRFPGVVAGLAGSLAMSCVSPDLRFGVTSLAFAALLGAAMSFERRDARPLPGGKLARVAALVAGVALLAYAAHDVARRLEIARLSRPAPRQAPDPELVAALEPLRAAAAAAPDDADAQLRLGLVLESLGRYPDAARAYDAALDLRPDDPVIVRRVAITGVLSGAYDASMPALARALADTPDDVDLRYLLAFAHYGRGDLLASIREVQTILERDPEHEKARVLLEALRE